MLTRPTPEATGTSWRETAQGRPVAGASVDTIVTNNNATHTKSVVTVPIIDYIDNTSPYHCSYPESLYPNQQSYNPYVHPNGDNCGNGVSAANGQYIVDTDIPATDIPNSTSIAQLWVQHFVKTFGAGAAGGVGVYELDNEPNGWIAVQHDVRPQNIGYTDLTTRSVAYAAAIKAADPTALVLGPGDIAPADENCNAGGQSGHATTISQAIMAARRWVCSICNSSPPKRRAYSIITRCIIPVAAAFV